MPRDYFHVFDDIVTLDEEGLEMHDDEAAMREAVRNARILARTWWPKVAWSLIIGSKLCGKAGSVLARSG
jgi:hypothetical protein